MTPRVGALFALCFIATAAPLNGSRPDPLFAGVRLRLTSDQLDNVAYRWEQLPLTPEQKQRVLAATGKQVLSVEITYMEPDGELAELGYNLALRDRPDSIFFYYRWALDKAKIAAKLAEDNAMIGPPAKPKREYRSSMLGSFLIDSQGRIWSLTGVSDFAGYAKTLHGISESVWIDSASPKDSSSLAYQDTLRFMKSQLKKSGATVFVDGK